MGISIIGVVLNHSSEIILEILCYGVNRELLQVSSSCSAMGGGAYYLLLFLRQLLTFCVPAFFFTSGYFVAFTNKVGHNSSARKAILKRLYLLLIPYIVWSIILFIIDKFQGETNTLSDYIYKFFISGVVGPYWYIPALCYLYIISIIVLPYISSKWKNILIGAAVVQLLGMVATYYNFFYHQDASISFYNIITSYVSIIHSVLPFFLGIAFGMNPNLLQIFKKYKTVLLLIYPVILLFDVLESDFLIRTFNNIHIGAYQGTISYNLFWLLSIVLIMLWEKSPNSKFLSRIGAKSYGIYLLHFPILSLLSKYLVSHIPSVMTFPLLPVTLLLVCGIALPMAAIEITNRTYMRHYSQYLFG